MAALNIALFIARVAALVGFIALLFRLRSRVRSRLGVVIVSLCTATIGILVLRQLVGVWSAGPGALQAPLLEDTLAPLQRIFAACLMLCGAYYFWNTFHIYERDVETMRQGHKDLAGEIERKTNDLRTFADELDEKERHFRRLVEHMPIACCTFDHSGKLLTWNRAAETMYGYSAAEAVGKRCLDLIATPNNAKGMRRTIQQVFNNERIYRVEWRDQDRFGRRGWRMGNAFSVGSGDGSVRYGVAMAIDITEQKRFEKACNKERQLLRQLYNLQERERQTLASELHDGMIQYLVGAKLQLDTFRQRQTVRSGSCPDTLDAASRHLQSALAEGRRMVSDLRPLIIDEQGLVAAIEHLINDANRNSAVKISFHHDDSFAYLEPMIENTIFRIVQESLTNVCRHSAAERATVSLVRVNGHIDLTVEDDGRGFDVADVPGDRFGVRGIKERARLFGGSAKIRTAPGRGSRIEVELPVHVGPPPALDPITPQPDVSVA